MPDNPVKWFIYNKPNDCNRNHKQHLIGHSFQIHCTNFEIEAKEIAEEKGKKDNKQVERENDPSGQVAA